MTKRTNEQQEAFEKFSKLKCGAAFMQMGTGKTKLALDLMDSKKEKVDMFLWICPCSLKSEIEQERKKWYPNMQIEIVGCESIGSSDRIYLELLNKIGGKSVFTVVDESLKIKNRWAKRTQRILEIGRFSKYRFILNGTPVSRNILDLWTQMKFLSPKILDMNFYQFKNTFCEYYTTGKNKGRIRAEANIPYLISLIEPYIYECELKIDTIQNHEHIRYYLNDENDYVRYKNYLFDLYYDDEEQDLNFYAFTIALQKYYCKNSNKMETISDLLERIGDKTIIFVKYLESIPDGALKITGDTPTDERRKIIDDFRDGETSALWLTYGVGAYGLNLQFCQNIIFAEQVWDYAQQVQAEARIYRLGQGEKVNYYHLYCDGVGLEDLISDCILKKDGLLNSVKSEITKQKKKDLKEFIDTL